MRGPSEIPEFQTPSVSDTVYEIPSSVRKTRNPQGSGNSSVGVLQMNQFDFDEKIDRGIRIGIF